LKRKLTWQYALLAVLLVCVSIIALQQHGPVQFTEGLLKTQILPSLTANQELPVQRSPNATLTAPSQNEQPDELKLDDLIGSFGVEATIYKIPDSRGEQNEQANMEIEGKPDATLKPDLNSQLQEEILLIDTTGSIGSGISSNPNQTKRQHSISLS